MQKFGTGGTTMTVNKPRYELFYKDKLASMYPDQILKFEVPAANVRADAVLLTDPITAFEIKTERDTLERLENQVANYFKVFPQVVAVVHVSKAEKAVELLKNTCAGVWSADDDGEIEVIKKGSINTDNIDHDAVFAFLRKYEHGHILRKYFGALPDSNDFRRYRDWLELFRTLSKDTIIKEMRDMCYLRWYKDRGKKDFFGLEN